MIIDKINKDRILPLSRLSNVVGGLKAINQTRIYVPHHRKKEAVQIIQKL